MNAHSKASTPFLVIVALAFCCLMGLPASAYADESSVTVNSGWKEIICVVDKDSGGAALGDSYGWKIFSAVTVTDGVVSDVVITGRGNNMVKVPDTELPYYEPCHFLMEQAIIDASLSAFDPDAVDDIDVVSGATSTSYWIKEATKEALVKWNDGRELGNATVSLSPASTVYSGKVLTPAVAVTTSTGIDLTQGSDFTVAYANNTNAGTATVTVTAAEGSIYTGSNTATFIIAPAAQTIKAAKTYTVKFAKVKKKKQTVAVKFTANGGGKVTYAAAKNGKVSIAKNGKVTVKKGTKKGTYTLKVKATAAAKGNYAKTTQTVALKVKVA